MRVTGVAKICAPKMGRALLADPMLTLDSFVRLDNSSKQVEYESADEDAG